MTARLALTLVALLLPAVGVAYVRVATGTQSGDFDATTLPERFGSLELVQDEILEPAVLAQIDPAAYSFRLYADPGASAGIWSYVAFYRGRDGAGAHDPEVCYPAQGWEVVDRGVKVLDMPDGTPFHATWLRAYQGGREEFVLHWFQPVGRWPRAPLTENFLRVLDSVRGQPQYAFVRLSMPSAETGSKTGEELAALEAFGRRIAPLVREELER